LCAVSFLFLSNFTTEFITRTSLSIGLVIKSFDRPDRHGVDMATLKLLIAILLNSPRDAERHAVTGFWEPWNNPLYQLRLLDPLLSLPAGPFDVVQLPGQGIVAVGGVVVAMESLGANVQGHTWNSLQLFEVLVRLASSKSVEIQSCVREMRSKSVCCKSWYDFPKLLWLPLPELIYLSET